jgi:Curli production assembly/transport component CsgG
MKYSLFFSLFLLFFSQLHAQKTTIAIFPFNAPLETEDSYNRAQTIEGVVTSAFQQSNRFTLVERSRLDAIKKERNFQKGVDFIDGNVIEKTAAWGAQYIVTANISAAKTETIDYYGGLSHTFHADVIFDLRVLDVANGEVVATEHFQAQTNSNAGSPEKVFAKAIEEIQPKVDKFITKSFPIIFILASIEETNGTGEATKVLITCGSGVGLPKGQKLKVVEMIPVDIEGREVMRKKEIGEIKISKIEDENFSLCEVKKGGKDIAEKLGRGIKLKVILAEENEK